MTTWTPVSWSSSTIRRVASMPSSTGICTSIRAISGRCSLTSATPCCPSAASATTSMSSSASSRARIPLRIRAWSSISTTLIMTGPATGTRRRASRSHRTVSSRDRCASSELTGWPPARIVPRNPSGTTPPAVARRPAACRLITRPRHDDSDRCLANPHCSAGVARLIGGPWADGLAAELLRCHVRHRLSQLPAVAGEVLESAVPLAVLPFDRRLEHDGAMVAGAGECRVYVGDPHPDDVGDPAWLRRAPVAAVVGDDYGIVVADGQLGPMVLADPRALGKAESGAQEGHCGAHVGVDKYRHDRRGWHRAVVPHGRSFPSPSAGGHGPSGRPISQWWPNGSTTRPSSQP